MVREPVTRNAGDPDAVLAAERHQGNRRRRELDDFSALMGTPHGRRFMARLLDITGFQKSSFTGNSTTFFNEGARNIGLQIWADIQEFPELYLKMLQEQKENQHG